MREGSLTMLTQRKLSNVLGSAIEGIDLSRELADAELVLRARSGAVGRRRAGDQGAGRRCVG
jgi:hypothetical protein